MLPKPCVCPQHFHRHSPACERSSRFCRAGEQEHGRLACANWASSIPADGPMTIVVLDLAHESADPVEILPIILHRRRRERARKGCQPAYDLALTQGIARSSRSEWQIIMIIEGLPHSLLASPPSSFSIRWPQSTHPRASSVNHFKDG